MQVKIIAVGKIKDDYLKVGINEYCKRLSAYCKLEIVEVEDLKIVKNASASEIELIKDKESKLVLSKIKEKEYIIALDMRGKEFSSEEFADEFRKIYDGGRSSITFVIGGSLGLSNEIIKKADLVFSFSKLTFLHQMIRLMLLEQIYRSYKIINNETYHK